jgi:hypothetical protein
MLLLTAVILLEPHGAGTKYTAMAIHGDEEGTKKHANMGFHDHWGKVLDQLASKSSCSCAGVRLGLINREVFFPVSEPHIPVRSDYLCPRWEDLADNGCALLPSATQWPARR